MLKSIVDWINYKIAWIVIFRIFFFKKAGQKIIDEATRQEGLNELLILNIIGSRMPGSAKKLSDHYINNIYEDPDLAEFTFVECKNIVEKDEVFDYFVNKHLRVLRDNDTFE